MGTRIRQNHKATNVGAGELTDLINQTPLYADSKEILIAYYRGKIEEIKEQLNKLTIQEHPQEIVKLARQIFSVKTMLSTLTEP
jgi:hypothetical protein